MNDDTLVSMGKCEFTERVTPKPIPEKNDMFFFKCPNCNGYHFRHAGYMETMMPFIRADGTKIVSLDDYQVKVCVSCKNCYIWLNERMWDVTNRIDIKAWEKLEKEVHKATGPGGDC